MANIFKCTTCNQNFYSIVDCEAHLPEEAQESDRHTCVPVSYRCPVCGRIFGHWSDCKNHSMRAHRVYLKSCEEVLAERLEA